MLHAVVLGGPGRLLHSIRRFCTAKLRPRSAMLVAAGAVVFFQVVGETIRRAGGIPNQFTGDGVMALFGVGVTPEEGSRQALRAAADMVRGVAALSDALAGDLPSPLRIGVGIHLGPAVVGRMGYADTVYLTAVGDTVNVASRIEQLTKDFDAELVVSESLALRAGLDVSSFPRHELTVRNRAAPLPIRVIANAGVLGETRGELG